MTQRLLNWPWRPMDNREKRARWALKYYMLYQPYGHPTKENEHATKKEIEEPPRTA